MELGVIIFYAMREFAIDASSQVLSYSIAGNVTFDNKSSFSDRKRDIIHLSEALPCPFLIHDLSPGL